MDPDVAWRLIQHSIAVYSNPEEIREWTCRACEVLGGRDRFSLEKYSKVPVGRTGTTAFYIGYDHILPGIVISFRGTISAEQDALKWYKLEGNMIGNVNIFKSTFDAPFETARKFGMPTPSRSAGDLRVHNGFFNFYKALQGRSDEITESLRKLLSWRGGNEGYLRGNVYFTGHSLGGALAILAAADLGPFINSYGIKHFGEANRKPIMYNFGSPRAGDTCFVEFYHRHVSASYRMVHKPRKLDILARDIVQHGPPKIKRILQTGCPFKHVLKQEPLLRDLVADKPFVGAHPKKKYLETIQKLYLKIEEITEADILKHQEKKKLANYACRIGTLV